MAYVVAMALSFVSPIAAVLIAALVVLMWLVPDRRIEKVLAEH